VRVNDWSARDLQTWEYQPLGPFLGKSFATSISPWVVTFDALAPYRVAPPRQDPLPLEYLRGVDDFVYDIALEVTIESPTMREHGVAPFVVTRSNARHLYWTFAQQLAHAASNGAPIRAGDLFATGTISGPEPASAGSLMELTWRGTRPLVLPDGTWRSFLLDGDVVTMRAHAGGDGAPRVGFGCVTGEIRPAAHG
jgi:fumarylacetoacetase